MSSASVAARCPGITPIIADQKVLANKQALDNKAIY